MAIEHLAAAEALRKFASLKAENVKLAKENAELKREKRANAIFKLANEKSVVLPRSVDLMKCAEAVLDRLEICLNLISTGGAIKLGEAEDQDGVAHATARPGMTELDRLLLDPEGFAALEE